jgi:putative addiction module component (TIGR02574 family)
MILKANTPGVKREDWAFMCHGTGVPLEGLLGMHHLRLEQSLPARYCLHIMTVTIQNLFTAAMSLDADSRRDLAERIWDTVQTQEESVFSEDTWREIGRRVAASDAGQVEHIAGDIALAGIRAEHGLASSR